MSENKVLTGVVDWFDPKKGYGFIKCEQDGKDIFCHYSDINMEGYKVIMAGNKVSFTEDNSFKSKRKAANITIVERKVSSKK